MGEEQSPTMKYHYFHGRFTYSVKRSGPRAVVLPRGVDCLVRLDSCVEACAVLTGFGRSGRFLAGLGVFRGSLARWGRLASSVSPVGAYSVKRSELRTVLDGEFDWGGTSVKR